jgi:hypothetical protein
MGVLKSQLFTTGDPFAVKKLEDCANGRPSEVASHFVEGLSSGEHIRRLKQALANVGSLDPKLAGMPKFTVDEDYDTNFANAIAFYKEKRGILNFANKIDRIVGIKTCRALDADAAKIRTQPPEPPRPAPKPKELPRPLPNCAPRSEIPFSRDFSIRILGMIVGGEGLEFSKIFWAVKDRNPANGAAGLSTLYSSTGVGLGTPSGAPFTVTGGGEFKSFTTNTLVKVTDFESVQLVQATSPVLPLPPDPKIPQPIPLPNLTQKGIAGVAIQFIGADGRTHSTSLLQIDTGVANLQGAGGQIGPMKVLSLCKGERGAVRRELGVGDIVF